MQDFELKYLCEKLLYQYLTEPIISKGGIHLGGTSLLKKIKEGFENLFLITVVGPVVTVGIIIGGTFITLGNITKSFTSVGYCDGCSKSIIQGSERFEFTDNYNFINPKSVYNPQFCLACERKALDFKEKFEQLCYPLKLTMVRKTVSNPAFQFLIRTNIDLSTIPNKTLMISSGDTKRKRELRVFDITKISNYKYISSVRYFGKLIYILTKIYFDSIHPDVRAGPLNLIISPDFRHPLESISSKKCMLCDLQLKNTPLFITNCNNELHYFHEECSFDNRNHFTGRCDVCYGRIPDYYNMEFLRIRTFPVEDSFPLTMLPKCNILHDYTLYYINNELELLSKKDIIKQIVLGNNLKEFDFDILASIIKGFRSIGKLEIKLNPELIIKNIERFNTLNFLMSYRYKISFPKDVSDENPTLIEKINEQYTCHICMENNINTKMLCGHCLCLNCWQNVKDCPSCRKTKWGVQQYTLKEFLEDTKNGKDIYNNKYLSLQPTFFS